MLLSELKTGESAIIIKVMGHGGFRRRILEMGFVRGQKVTALLNAPLNDPIKYKIMDYEVSLRHSEAKMIVIEPHSASLEESDRINTTLEGDITHKQNASSEESNFADKYKEINIALVGNPNSGKTSLFNALSVSVVYKLKGIE